MRIGIRRLAALLAGGVVLAGGGVTTLAAWQDQTYTTAPLSLTRFDVLQSTGSAWVQADTSANAGVVSLYVAGSLTTPLVPGGATTGWVGLRTDTGSMGAAVTLNGATIGSDPLGLAGKLTYTAVSGVTQQKCQDGDLSGGTVLVPAGSALTVGGSGLHLAAGTASAQGAPTWVCLKVSLQDDIGSAFSGASLSPVWRFDATSE